MRDFSDTVGRDSDLLVDGFGAGLDVPSSVTHKSKRPGLSVSKRIFDAVLALTGLLLLSPLLLVIAVAIRLTSRGPAIFRQVRYGKDKQTFEVLKFRTMTVAETRGSFVQASRGDARITRIGAFLRRTSLDELPQLWNVVRGDMSLIGPRPHPTALDEKYETVVPNYRRRFETRPGISGLAQVRGQRGATETADVMAERVASDIEYINKWSFGHDIRILLSTLKVLLGDEKAY